MKLKLNKKTTKKISARLKKTFFISSLAAFILFSGGIIYFSFLRNPEVAIIDGVNVENGNKIALEKDVRKVVAGSPMEQMVPFIVEKDPKVAAFLVSIAKKESNLGQRVPVLDGKDCYNYWGFRESRDKMGTAGHTCFDSPQDAVDTVAGRIENLVAANYDTPKEMVVWKCGFSCAGHKPASVQKWISDVNLFFKKIQH